MKLRLALCAAIVAALPAAQVFAQQNADRPATQQNDRATAQQNDRTASQQRGATSGQSITAEQFMKDAAAGGIGEVAAGREAAQRAADQEVRAFGQKMVDDHTKANNELKAIAERHNVELPVSPMPEQTAAMDRMRNVENTAFDAMYMRQMVEDHDKTIALFERGANVEQADVKAFAQKTLPVLRQHAEHARQLNARIGDKSDERRRTPAERVD